MKRAVAGRMRLELSISKVTPQELAGRDLTDAMEELQKLLGSSTDVHFTEIRKGSTVIVAEVGIKQISGARERMALAAHAADPGVRRHFDKLNQVVARAGTSAQLQEVRRTRRVTWLEFPGAPRTRPLLPPIRDRVVAQGYLYRIEGKDKSIHGGLNDAGTLYSLVFTLAQAKEAAHHLFRHVRVEGEALRSRDASGRWLTGEIAVQRLEPADDVPLADTLAELQALGGFGWRDAPQDVRALITEPDE